MKVELGPVRPWRHDLGHCLHATLGVLLGFANVAPLEVLGAAWSFFYRPRNVRREEYYWPCRNGDLAASVCPYHGVRSRWHHPPGAEEGVAEVHAAVAAGAPVAVAVDNFYLPFRPAFRDVHTNHLLTVYGFDDEARHALVADAVPPRYQGPLALSDFVAARGSSNPIRHDRDLFFTANPIAHRWLEVDVPARMPALDAEFLRFVVESNLRGFGARGADDAYEGIEGAHRFLVDALARLGRGEAVVDEVFIVSGTALAAAGVHADYLLLAADRFGSFALVEAARAVERVASHWAALRIALAELRDVSAPRLEGIRRRVEALVRDHRSALARLEHALEAGAF